MRAIVLVDHGSRNAEANRQLDTLAGELRAQMPDRQVVTAHMELASPTLPEAIDACVEAGAREVVVALWFLAPGRHGTEDVPAQVEEARSRHPQIVFDVSAPLGVHPGLVEALVDRINECGSHSHTG